MHSIIRFSVGSEADSAAMKGILFGVSMLGSKYELFICLAASIPFITGIFRSIKIMSKNSFPANSTASSPLFAMETCCTPRAYKSKADMDRVMAGSSLTTSTFRLRSSYCWPVSLIAEVNPSISKVEVGSKSINLGVKSGSF